ncbi:MAG: hypothetical protein NTZ10_01035 [Candidatus Saganbacteria bacterium]|nr:hypothetical protein [Candidatus Saganbacteria bacterium]
MLLISKYGHTATLGKFMFGHGRFLGVHDPLSSQISKAADPFINNWTLARLSRSEYFVARSGAFAPQNDVLLQLIRRITTGTISTERLMSVQSNTRDQAFQSLPCNKIAASYLAAGIVPKYVCVSVMLDRQIDHQRKMAAFATIKAFIADSEIRKMVESLNDGDPMLAVLSSADNAGRGTLMRIIEKSPEDHSNAFKRLCAGLSGADITRIYNICKDDIAMGLIAAHPETSNDILLLIALKNERAKATIDGVRRAQSRVVCYLLDIDVLERLLNVADSIHIIEQINGQSNATPALKARCEQRILKIREAERQLAGAAGKETKS